MSPGAASSTAWISMTTAVPSPPQPGLARPPAATSATPKKRTEEQDGTGCQSSASLGAQRAASRHAVGFWLAAAAAAALLVAPLTLALVVAAAAAVAARSALRHHLDGHGDDRAEPLDAFLHQLEALDEGGRLRHLGRLDHECETPGRAR